MTEPSTAHLCPACGAEASGRFCASCGASLGNAHCTACGTTLVPGASFCHRCGQPVGAGRAASVATRRVQAQDGLGSSLPWLVAGIALLSLIGLVAWRYIAEARSGQVAVQGGVPVATEAGVRAPDISQMSPREVAARLYERVMRLHAEGKTDSVGYFAANMAIPAFRMLDSLDADARFELGRVAEVSKAYPLAREQADAILREQPSHLLGLVLAARVAAATGDTRAQREFERRLLEAAPTESQRRLPEYEAHAPEIQNALAEARRRG